MGDYSKKDAGAEVGETIAWTIADALGEAKGAANTIFCAYQDIRGEIEGFNVKAPPNPLFVTHGFTDGASPKTLKYLGNRTRKKFGSKAISKAGSLTSAITQVDVAGVLRHANATGSTLAHMKMLHDIAKKYPGSELIQGWIKTCILAKSCKAGIRGTELVGAAVPVGAVGITTSIAAAIARKGVKLKLSTIVSRTCMEIHWRANVEMRLSGIGGGKLTTKPIGPASAVMFELFRRRGATRVFGQYNAPLLISESGGWNALKDKLMLM